MRALRVLGGLLLAMCLAGGPAYAATANVTPTPIQHFEDNAGAACSGCKLFTYTAGTTTKQTTYTDSTEGTPNTNPVVLNTRGEANVWLDPTLTYKFVLAPSTDTDPPTNPFWTVDNIPGSVANSTALSSLPSQASGHLVGNCTNASSTPQDCSLSALLDQAASSSQGAVLYRNATTWVALAPGTSGQALITGGAGANVSWGNPSNGANPLAVGSASIRSGSGAPTATDGLSSIYMRTDVFGVYASTNGAGTYSKLSRLTTIQGQGSSTSTDAQVLNFKNGFAVSDSSGTETINATQASGNVTVSGGAITAQTGVNLTVTRTGTGQFTGTMSTAAANTTYVVLCTAIASNHLEACMEDTSGSARSTTVFYLDVHDGNGRIDPAGLNIVVLPNQ